MSVELDWAALDDRLAATVANVLDTAFHAATLPSYLGEISVTSFAFGDIDPDVQLIDIRDVDHEFQVEEQEDEDDMHHFPTGEDISLDLDSNASTAQPAPSLQMHVRVAYAGNLRIGIKTSLLINVPAPMFMSLPLSLTLTGIAFNGTFIVAYEGSKRSLHISISDPARDPSIQESDDDTMSFRSFERVRPADRLLTELVVESEVGQTDKHVLRNVGKVEKFILDLARSALENELIWPAFQTILF